MAITFELNGITYTANETHTYCYRWPTGYKGQRVRIRKADFETAYGQWMAETEGPAPKAKKSRTNKNAAFKFARNNVEVTLTEKQVDFIKHLPDTFFWENGLDSCIWVDCLCDDIGGQFAGKPMMVGAMISTLCEKGLGTRAKDRMNGRKCTSFALTELGKLVAAEVGLS